jgi:hypothetical protein
MCCARMPDDGVEMHVDHILPRVKYPHVALDIHNPQLRYSTCNWGKGNNTAGLRSPDFDTLDDLTKEFIAMVGHRALPK